MRLTYILRALARRKTARNQDGVTAIEFALVAPVLLLLVFGIIETSIVMYIDSVLESATTNTARLGKTGFTAAGISREQTLLNMLEARTGGLIDMSSVTVTSQVYPSFNSIGGPEPFQDTNQNGAHDSGENFTDINGNGQWDPDMAAEGLGQANDVVVYTISYPWSITTPLLGHLLGSEGTYTVTSHAVVKNEPYNIMDDPGEGPPPEE